MSCLFYALKPVSTFFSFSVKNVQFSFSFRNEKEGEIVDFSDFIDKKTFLRVEWKSFNVFSGV